MTEKQVRQSDLGAGGSASQGCFLPARCSCGDDSGRRHSDMLGKILPIIFSTSQKWKGEKKPMDPLKIFITLFILKLYAPDFQGLPVPGVDL